MQTTIKEATFRSKGVLREDAEISLDSSDTHTDVIMIANITL